MRVAVQTDPSEGLGEGPTGDLLMSGETAVLGNSIGEGKGVKLDVGIAMYESLLNGCNAVACTGMMKARITSQIYVTVR